MRCIAGLASTLGVTAALSVACSPGSSCDAGATIAGSIVDQVNAGGISGSFVILERGGVDSGDPNSDTYNADLQYVIPANGSGQYSLNAACGHYGVYGFAEGYKCASIEQSNGQSPQIALPRDANTTTLPTLTDATFTPAAAKPGGSVQFSATVATGDSSDPLSSLVLLANPTTYQVVALIPPGAGSKAAGYPDGSWQRTFTVPSQPGVVNYTFLAVTQGCQVSMQTVALDIKE